MHVNELFAAVERWKAGFRLRTNLYIIYGAMETSIDIQLYAAHTNVYSSLSQPGVTYKLNKIHIYHLNHK